MFFKNKTPALRFRNFALIVLGTAALAFGTAVFTLPYEIVAGGVSGLSIILEQILPIENASAELIISALTWLLFIFGCITLGKGFAIKTFLSSLLYPPFLAVFSYLASSGVLQGYFVIQASEYAEIGLLIASVFGGAFIGAGCALSFLGGGSTGGVDVIALSLCKLFPNLKSSKVIFAIDAAIVICGAFAIRDFVLSLMGILSALVSAALIDKVFLGANKAFVCSVISEFHEQINAAVIEKLGRTTTLISATGGFSGEEKKLINIIFSYSEYSELFSLIASIDPKAFIIVQRAHEISGEGWKNNE